MNVSTIVNDNASDVPATVNLAKPSVPMLPADRAPAVGDIVRIPARPRCGDPVKDENGNYGYGTCVRTLGHDRAVVGCVAVSFERYGENPNGVVDYTLDQYRVTAVRPVFVPLGEAETTALRDRVETAEREARAAEQTIADIRDYVLERREAGDICDAGTLRFLRHFGMDAWERPFRVSYTVTFDVDALSEDNAETIGRGALETATGWRNGFSGSDVDVEHVDTTDLSD